MARSFEKCDFETLQTFFRFGELRVGVPTCVIAISRTLHTHYLDCYLEIHVGLASGHSSCCLSLLTFFENKFQFHYAHCML